MLVFFGFYIYTIAPSASAHSTNFTHSRVTIIEQDKSFHESYADTHERSSFTSEPSHTISTNRRRLGELETAILLLCRYLPLAALWAKIQLVQAYLDSLGLCGLEGGCVWWFGSGKLRRDWGGTGGEVRRRCVYLSELRRQPYLVFLCSPVLLLAYGGCIWYNLSVTCSVPRFANLSLRYTPAHHINPDMRRHSGHRNVVLRYGVSELLEGWHGHLSD